MCNRDGCESGEEYLIPIGVTSYNQLGRDYFAWYCASCVKDLRIKFDIDPYDEDDDISLTVEEETDFNKKHIIETWSI